MLEQLKDSLILQDGIRYERLRRSLSSASLHINQHQLQRLYNNSPSSQMRSYQLPTIASRHKASIYDSEKELVTCRHQHGQNKALPDQETIRY